MMNRNARSNIIPVVVVKRITLCMFLCLSSVLISGCRKSPKECSSDIEIMYVALSDQGLGQPLGMFVVRNNGTDDCTITGIKTVNANGQSPIASDLMKITHRMLQPNDLEYGIFRISSTDYSKNTTLHVEYKKHGREFYTVKSIEKSNCWSTSLYADQNLNSLYFYIETEKPVTRDNCHLELNGKKTKISDLVIYPTRDSKSLVCLKIEPPKALEKGERVFADVTFDDAVHYGAVSKAFHPFALGKTQYDKVVRPVSIEHTNGDVILRLYNEADFRKSPAVIEQVRMDGEDITDQCILPPVLPPDLHNFEQDTRNLIIKNLNLKHGDKRQFDIDFKRQKPLRAEATPKDYFETQTFSFDVQHNVPFEIDREEGLQDGACVLYAGLWPRPEMKEIIRRCSSIYEADPRVPVYIYPHEGTKLETAYQLAACCDFATAGQTIPLIPPTFGRTQKYFNYYEKDFKLPVPWVTSVMSDNDHFTSPEDLEWLVWGASGAGSHGILLTAPEKGDDVMVAKCSEGTERILETLKSQTSLLGISYPVKLKSTCNQEGIHFNFLACGTDDIMIVALNEWSSRSSFQESEPFMAAVRTDVDLTVDLGEWMPVSADNPISNKTLEFTKDDKNHICLKLPDFDNVQVVRLSRKKLEQSLNHQKTSITPVVFESSPIVSLGVVQPETVHEIVVPIRSNSEFPITFSGKDASHQNSKPGKVDVKECRLEPHVQGELTISYTAPMTTGNSVTHVCFESPDVPDFTMPVYICADIQEPVELSPTMIDVGYVPVGVQSDTSEIKVRSKNHKFTIGNIVPDSNHVVDVQKKDTSFSFSIKSDEVEMLSASIDVELLVDGIAEPIHKTVRCTGQVQTPVFALPPRISTVMGDQSKKYTVDVQHIKDLSIQITSVTAGNFIDAQVKDHQVEVTIHPEILKLGKDQLTIQGKIGAKEKFELIIPVTVFSTEKKDTSQEIVP